MVQTEQWLPIAGYEGSYEISNFGRVKSLARPSLNRPNRMIKERIRSTNIGWKGYIEITLRNGKKTKRCRIHVLVAEAFIGPRPDGHETRHLDGDPSNNTVSNLEYGPPLQNCHDSKKRYPDKCTKDHDLTIEGNIYRRKDQPGIRICKICHNERQKKYHGRPDAS